MAAFCSREWWSDARHYQIAALATLLVYNVFWVDYGAQPLNSLLAIGGVIGHPRRDIFRRRVLARRATLADGARGGNRAQHSYGSCGEE